MFPHRYREGAVVRKPAAPTLTVVDPHAVSYAEHMRLVDEVERLRSQLRATREELKATRAQKSLEKQLLSRVLTKD